MQHKAMLLLAIAALGGAIRWVALEWVYPVGLVGDEVYYVGVAQSLAREGVAEFQDSRALRPPAQAFVLSLLIPHAGVEVDPSGGGLHRLLLFEVALGTAVVVLTALLGAALFNWRTGLIAGVVAALYPNLVAVSHYLWSENLYALLLLLALLIVVRGQHARGLGHAAAAGVVFGAATLTRETGLLIGAMSALWWWLTAGPAQRSRALLKGALLGAVAVACVLPWTLRNYLVLGRLVPVSTIGWYATAEGSNLEAPDWMRDWGPKRAGFKAAYFGIAGELERLDFAHRYALATVAAESPTWVLKKLVRGLAQLFNPDSTLLYKLRFGAYGRISRATYLAVTGVSALPYVLVFLAGTLGMAAARGDGRLLLPVLVLGSSILTHVLTMATTRYRLPWMPLVIIYAAHFASASRAVLAAMTVRRWLVLAAIWLFFAAVCVPFFLRQFVPRF